MEVNTTVTTHQGAMDMLDWCIDQPKPRSGAMWFWLLAGRGPLIFGQDRYRVRVSMDRCPMSAWDRN